MNLTNPGGNAWDKEQSSGSTLTQPGGTAWGSSSFDPNAVDEYRIWQTGERFGITVDELLNSPNYLDMVGPRKEDAIKWLASLDSREAAYLQMDNFKWGRYDQNNALPESIPRYEQPDGSLQYNYDMYPFVPHMETGQSGFNGGLDNPFRVHDTPDTWGPGDIHYQHKGGPIPVNGGPGEMPKNEIRGGTGWDTGVSEEWDDSPSGKMAVPPATQYANNMNKDTLSTAANMMESTSQRSPMTITTPAKKIR
jgi:hypothetical protein